METTLSQPAEEFGMISSEGKRCPRSKPMLRQTQLQGRPTVCTPVGISHEENCRGFRDFLNQNKLIRITVSSRETAYRTHILTPGPLFEAVFCFPACLSTHGNSLSCNLLKNLGRSSRKAKHVPERNVCGNCETPENPEAKKAPSCTPVGFYRREGKKAPKDSEISSTKQNWVFSAELHNLPPKNCNCS